MFLPLLLAAEEGAVVNTSSVNGFWATLGPGIAHTSYSSAKFAVKGFTEALINDFKLNAPHLTAHVVMPGHIGTSIVINSGKTLGRDPKEMSDEEIQQARESMEARGIDFGNATNEQLRQAMVMQAEAFRDDAPTTAGQAAKIILDGVRAGQWRILVGEDAHVLDRHGAGRPGVRLHRRLLRASHELHALACSASSRSEARSGGGEGRQQWDSRSFATSSTTTSPRSPSSDPRCSTPSTWSCWARSPSRLRPRERRPEGAGAGRSPAPGRAFCAGGDVKAVRFTDASDNTQQRAEDHWAWQVLSVTKPTLAAVNGIAAGGGLSLALACDIRIASDLARFSAIFARIGMPVLDGAGWLLSRAVGESRALEMLYTADKLGAEEALRIGLVGHLVPHDELASALRASWPGASRRTRRWRSRARRRWSGRPRTSSYLEHLPVQWAAMDRNLALARHDVEEGGRAFAEKREPRFRGLEGD